MILNDLFHDFIRLYYQDNLISVLIFKKESNNMTYNSNNNSNVTSICFLINILKLISAIVVHDVCTA